jgi:hypothetical protein
MTPRASPVVSAPLHLALAAALSAALACAGPSRAPAPGAAGGAPAPERRAQQATPEPDPGCRATVQAPLAVLGLSQVTVKLALDPPRGVRLVEVLAPELSPAETLRLRLAFEQCPWRPTVDQEGNAETWTATFLRLNR